MARIAGVDLPREKRIEAGLCPIFGIGPTRAIKLCEVTGVSPDTRVRDLTDEGPPLADGGFRGSVHNSWGRYFYVDVSRSF